MECWNTSVPLMMIQDKSYKDLSMLLTRHFEPEALVISECFHLHQGGQLSYCMAHCGIHGRAEALCLYLQIQKLPSQSCRRQIHLWTLQQRNSELPVVRKKLTLKGATELATCNGGGGEERKRSKGSNTAIQRLSTKQSNTSSLWLCFCCGWSNDDPQNCLFMMLNATIVESQGMLPLFAALAERAQAEAEAIDMVTAEGKCNDLLLRTIWKLN